MLTRTGGQGQLSAVIANPEMLNPADRQKRARAAHRAAVGSFSKVVAQLVALIGAQLTAYIGEVGEVRAVRAWIAGNRVPSATTQSKLQLALQIAQELKNEGEEGAIEAWFQGLNPWLDDRPPAEVLRNAVVGKLSTTGRQVLFAARDFANS